MSMISSVSTDIASSALVMMQQVINDLLDHHRKAINHSESIAMWNLSHIEGSHRYHNVS